MKITTNQYAQALFEATEEKSQKEISHIIINFVKALAKNSQLKLKNDIIKKFQEIYNQEKSIVEAEIISRDEINENLQKYLIEYISDKYGAKKVVLKTKLDKNIKGGIIIKVGNEIIDGSVKHQFMELKKILEK